MNKPNFFIIGAPKAGTTSLASWLSENPNVFVSAVKEPFFFSKDVVPSDYKSIKDYEKLFTKATNDFLAIGEASTTYLRSSIAIHDILKYQPEARFIVMLRNPVEVAVSLHSQEVYSLNEDILDFDEAWDAQIHRSVGRCVPPTCRSKELLLYKNACLFGNQLRSLYESVPSQRVCLIFFEDLKERPDRVLEKVECFLKVPHLGRRNFERKNPNKVSRFKSVAYLLKIMERIKLRLGVKGGSGLLKIVHIVNKKKIDRSDISSITKQKLLMEFRSDIEIIEELTGRNLDHWKC